MSLFTNLAVPRRSNSSKSQPKHSRTTSSNRISFHDDQSPSHNQVLDDALQQYHNNLTLFQKVSLSIKSKSPSWMFRKSKEGKEGKKKEKRGEGVRSKRNSSVFVQVERPQMDGFLSSCSAPGYSSHAYGV